MKIQDALDLHLKEEASRIIGEGLDADSASLALADGVLTIRVASPVQRNRRTLTLSD